MPNTTIWIIIRPSVIPTWLTVHLAIHGCLRLTHVVLSGSLHFITLVQDITKECGKIGLLLGIGGTHEDLISWIVCIPVGDCGAESIVRVRESCGGCDSVEHGLGEKRAWGGRKSILDGHEEEYGSERSGVPV